jgi:hypothetical protein
LVEQVKSIVTLLYEVVSSRPHEWETYLPSARSAMTALDRIHFFRDPQRYAEQAWMLHGIQGYAYHDPDSGCIRDIAEWCQASWLRILRNFPDDVQTLTGMPNCSPHKEATQQCSNYSHIYLGLGSNWLQRSQATLARIQREEGNDSSSQGSGQASGNFQHSSDSDVDQDSDDDLASPPSDPRRQGPLYVEARGYLQPAVDFYARAVRAADALGSTTGDLLASVSKVLSAAGQDIANF